MQRRVDKAESVYGFVPEGADWIEQVLNDLQTMGHINDYAFARSRVTKGIRQGKSKKLIEQDLAQAGVLKPEQEAALKDALSDFSDDEDPELQAARTYVRKRGLGPYRQNPSELEQRDLAKLARRGFSYEIAQRALAR